MYTIIISEIKLKMKPQKRGWPPLCEPHRNLQGLRSLESSLYGFIQDI